ncbi:MAG: phosphoenolpyruvate carboxykinase (GTP) [Candidatus Omnitrophica bacterium]|nr:phosphoenolpyruvate carboxykinase (GTP) [Candidatus Omnitrophota bacterium]MCM8793255.1 phosphoenolpyruvate carboxykinase (GTP) [Candidatus Omnitrophota bacterium]
MMNDYFKKLESLVDKTELEKLEKIKHPTVHRFIYEAIVLCRPKNIFICADTPDEIAYIKNMAIVSGEESAALITPGHTFHFDGPQDQGRDRQTTKFLVPHGERLNPVLNQIEREEGLKEIFSLLKNSMRDKTMIVRFLSLGPIDSVFSTPCMECTDSWYVAHSVDLLYREGYKMFCDMDEVKDIFKTLHSAGRLDKNRVSLDWNKKRIYIDYLTDTVYSVNTQYAGNSIGFKKLALRLAIRKAHREGWLAEHFMIMGVKGQKNRKTYLAGAFPSACGKTSTAMLPGETILADDLAYVKEINGECRAVNVEKGIFGIIQDVNPKDDPLIYEILTSPGEIIFSNVLIKDGRPWWLGMGRELPKEGRNYTGDWYDGKTDEKGERIFPSHKNARYTVSLKALPNCDSALDDPQGVVLSGIMFGGRDYSAYFPVQEGFDWEHGIIAYGVSLETETTFALVEEEGKYEINIMSIQDFVSIPLSEYIRNYLAFGKKLRKVPLVFGVNYFLRDLKTGEYLNARQDKHIWIKWMELRANGEVGARKTPTGLIPLFEDLRYLFKQILDKEYTQEDYQKQFSLRLKENLRKIERIERFLQNQIPDAPEETFRILEEQKKRLLQAREELGEYITPDNFSVV